MFTNDHVRLGGAAIAFAAAIVLASPAPAETASALLREDEMLPGAPGENIDSINNTAVNQVGGYAATVNTSGSGTTLGHIWGNATGGPGTVIITEGLFGDLQQTAFESFFGLADSGAVGYSPSSNNVMTGDTGLDGAWVDGTPVLNELDPIPVLPGMFSTFNSRVGMTAGGQPYWIGGITDTQGGGTQDRVLFFDFNATPLIMGGDPVGGVPEPVKTMASSIDFDTRLTNSSLGTNYITVLLVEGPTASDGVLAINGDAVMAGGSVTREASPVPAGIGGLPGENWDNFDFLGITEGGAWMATGDTDASTSEDEFIMINGEIVLREGDMVSGSAGTFPLSGTIEGGYFNESGDWAVIWDVNTPGNVEVLLLNGEILLLEGDAVDWNGDGVIDAGDDNGLLANFTGISSLTMGPRDAFGSVDIYFTADIDFKGTSSSGDDREGFFRLTAQAGPAFVPVDIKPGGCPNSFNRNSNGVLTVALVGTDDIPAAMIDASSVAISRADGMGGSQGPNEGPPGPHSVLDDVATPFDGAACDCHDLDGDGLDDLKVHFRTDDLVAALMLDSLPSGALVELVVSGTLLDGTEFEGTDCVRLVPPNAGPAMLAVSANRTDTWVDVSPLDLTLDGGGFDSFLRWYPESSEVRLTAAPYNFLHNLPLLGWRINGNPQIHAGTVHVIVLDGTIQSVEAVYGPNTPKAGPAPAPRPVPLQR